MLYFELGIFWEVEKFWFWFKTSVTEYLLKNQCKPCSSVETQHAQLPGEGQWGQVPLGWLCRSSGNTDSLMLGCTFCGCVAESFTALTHPGMSVGRLGLCCWQTGTTIAQFDSRYMNKTAQVYCTVWQPCINAEGLINGGFSGTDKLLVGNEDFSTQRWQGYSCWLIPTCFLPLDSFLFLLWFDYFPFPFLPEISS